LKVGNVAMKSMVGTPAIGQRVPATGGFQVDRFARISPADAYLFQLLLAARVCVAPHRPASPENLTIKAKDCCRAWL
jgi:hypothetical protein